MSIGGATDKSQITTGIHYPSRLQAILLSDGQETLPYAWLAYTQMQSEEWSIARETLQDALKLEPWSTPLLYRLSACYERERNYIEACDIMQRAMQLTPYDEREPYRLHFARLTERSKDMKGNTSREDPFDMLPLEVVLNIMEEGLEMDDDFVLRASWVCQRWRHILVYNCPKLWEGLTISSADLRSDVAHSKRQIWLARSKEHISSLTFRGFNCGASRKIPATFMKQMNEVQHLTLSVSDRKVLSNFAWKLDNRIGPLKTLRLSGQATKNSGAGGVWRAWELKDLCFSFVKQDAKDDLKIVELHKLDLGESKWSNRVIDRQYWDEISRARTVSMYPSLKRLSVKGCTIDNAYDVNLFVTTHRLPILEYQCDPVHMTLRGTPALEDLEVDIQWRRDNHPAGPGLGRRITLLNLSAATVPPPSLWCVDILAPNLQSLIFKTPSGFDSKTFDELNGIHQKPLIPEVIDSPIRLETLPNLRTLELVCYERDSESRLEKWIPHLSSLTKLTLRSLGGNPWPKESNSAIPDQRASVNIVRMLTEHPEWCPNLQDLELERCFATGNNLVELVRTRKRSSICASLERLAVSQNITLGKNPIAVLRKELPVFQQGEKLEPKIAKRQPKEYKKDTFKR